MAIYDASKSGKMDYGTHIMMGDGPTMDMDKKHTPGHGYAVGDSHGIYDASKPSQNMKNMEKALKNSERSIGY